MFDGPGTIYPDRLVEFELQEWKNTYGFSVPRRLFGRTRTVEDDGAREAKPERKDEE